jgi:hypothetical protein
MQSESPAREFAAAPQVGSDELAEGLMLVRATSLKMIRLQLAIERRDRRVALEAVDDLVALDRRLQDYLADVSSAQLMFRHALDAERAALNREKLTLAAEVIHGGAKPEPVAEEVPEPADPWEDLEFEEESTRRISWLVAILVLVSALAGGAYWFASPDAIAALAGAFS